MILCTFQSKGFPGSDSVCIAHSDSPGYPLDEKYIYDRFVRPPTIYFFQNGKGIQKTYGNQDASFCILKTKIFWDMVIITKKNGKTVCIFVQNVEVVVGL